MTVWRLYVALNQPRKYGKFSHMMDGIMETNPKETIIKAFFQYLKDKAGLDYQIIDYPDTHIRNKPACDAIALVGKEKIALEHTSIDSVLEQRLNDSRLLKVLRPLEKEMSNRLPQPGHYLLVVHLHVIPTGINWDDVRFRIRNWCLNVAPTLEIGGPRSSPKHFKCDKPTGVPFEVCLYRWPRRNGQFFIGQFAPDNLEDMREDVLHRALTSRGKKVSRYRKFGYRTVLLLESNDLTLASSSAIGLALVRATTRLPKEDLPDEVYLVETDVSPWFFHCLKLSNRMFPEAEPI